MTDFNAAERRANACAPSLGDEVTRATKVREQGYGRTMIVDTRLLTHRRRVPRGKLLHQKAYPAFA